MKFAEFGSQFFVFVTFFASSLVFDLVAPEHNVGGLGFQDKLVQERHGKRRAQGSRGTLANSGR